MAYSIDHHKRLKPKKESTFGKVKKAIRKKRNSNDKELEYLNWAKEQELGCFVCNSRLTELHHVKRDSTDRKDHTRLIPLCKEHHTGDELSPHGTPSLWRSTYTMEVQLEYGIDIYRKFLKSIL